MQAQYGDIHYDIMLIQNTKKQYILWNISLYGHQVYFITKHQTDENYIILFNDIRYWLNLW